MPRSCIKNRPDPSGFTLVEAVIALVIIAVAVTALFTVFTGPMARSADPMIVAQARAIASAYMDEILSQDPGTGTETDRALFTAVGEYDNIENESPPRNQFGTQITELAAYTVDVDVSPVDVTSNDNYQEIEVRVRHDSGRVDLRLRGRRGDY